MSHRDGLPVVIQLPKGRQLEDSARTLLKQPEDGEELRRSDMTDAIAQERPEDGGLRMGAGTEGQARGQMGQKNRGDRVSVRSVLSLPGASSWTESERELKIARGAEEEVGLVCKGAGHKDEGMEHLKTEEDAGENHLPEKAAQVFSPALPCPSSPRDTEAFFQMDPGENYSQHGYQYEADYSQHGYQYGVPSSPCNQECCGRDMLKVGVSLMTAALLFPALVWGGFVFLPFDAPLLDSAPLRLVYTLRCSIFAVVPIILGWLVLGVSRLRSGATEPVVGDDVKEAELQEVTVHRRFISDSASLFLIYFLQLVVMAMYLSQEQLKLISLLTIVFAFGRLAYWLAAAFGSSLRGFGFGLSFLPSVVMMVANFYFIFTVEAGGSIFSGPHPPEEALPPPTDRRRFWG